MEGGCRRQGRNRFSLTPRLRSGAMRVWKLEAEQEKASREAGARLRELRQAAGMTQEDLSFEANCTALGL